MAASASSKNPALMDGDIPPQTQEQSLEKEQKQEELPILADSSQAICQYSTGKTKERIPVPLATLKLFRLLRNLNEDCASSDDQFYANIPTLNDAKHREIYFTKNELAMFFDLAAREPRDIEYFKTFPIAPELLKRFLILANFLDYEEYLNYLCEYTAILIKAGKFTL